MQGLENQLFSNRVVHYYENCTDKNKINTVRHFVAEGKSKRTIYNVLSRYEANGTAEFRKIKGRPCVKMSPKKVKKVEKAFKRDPSISVRVAAKKLNMKKSTVSKIKVNKLGITARVKTKAPKYSDGQEARVKTGCRKVYNKTRKKVLVIDDETYVTFDPKQSPGRQFVHAVDHKELRYEDRFKHITKFPKKYLVWQAMDETGKVSEPYISEGTMTGEIYLNECLKKRLIPFILKHHEIEDIVFWPDLATCHYANIVKDFLQEKAVDFVQKKDNPPNVPQARGIEKFWAECKRRYSERPSQPKNLHGFKLIWHDISKEAARVSGKAVMDHAYKVLRQIGYKGLRQAMVDISNRSNV